MCRRAGGSTPAAEDRRRAARLRQTPSRSTPVGRRASLEYAGAVRRRSAGWRVLRATARAGRAGGAGRSGRARRPRLADLYAEVEQARGGRLRAGTGASPTPDPARRAVRRARPGRRSPGRRPAVHRPRETGRGGAEEEAPQGTSHNARPTLRASGGHACAAPVWHGRPLRHPRRRATDRQETASTSLAHRAALWRGTPYPEDWTVLRSVPPDSRQRFNQLVSPGRSAIRRRRVDGTARRDSRCRGDAVAIMW